MGILRGVRNYPIYRGKFEHYNLLGFSSSVHPFVTKTCDSFRLRIAVQIKKTLGQTIGGGNIYANFSNPSEITPVDESILSFIQGSSYKKRVQ